MLNNEDLLRTSRTAQQVFAAQAWQSEFYTQHPCRGGRIELLPQRCALTSTLQHTHTQKEREFFCLNKALQRSKSDVRMSEKIKTGNRNEYEKWAEV